MDKFVIEPNEQDGKKFCGFYIREELDKEITKLAKKHKRHKRTVVEKCIEYALAHMDAKNENFNRKLPKHV